MWNITPFEKQLETALVSDFGQESGEKYLSRYNLAKNYLIDHIYGEIKGREPQLSDHGERHIANVLKNVDFLIGGDYKKLNGINLYCLAIIILFHDVGNVDGREDHHKKIAQVYNQVREKKPEFDQERACILTAAGAHTGFSSKDGTTDTLKDVPDTDHIDGHKINLRELSALLRLADECAEGYQRTSDYLDSINAFDAEKSKIYHDYAKMTNVFIDPSGERIVLTYNIDIKTDQHPSWLRDRLNFIFKRIIKLDGERRYCKYYTQILYKFKRTEVTLNFTIDGIPSGFVMDKIILEDKCPQPLRDDEIDTAVVEAQNQFKIDSILENIDNLMKANNDGNA